MEIKIDELSDYIKESLTEYSKKVIDVIDKTGNDASKNATRKLKQRSPKKTGRYAKSWKYKSFNTFGNPKEYKIYSNAPMYRLTHLLEYGHMTRNGNRTKAIPHIEPVEKEAIVEYEEKIKKGIENV